MASGLFPTLTGMQLRNAVVELMRHEFGMATGALDDWSDLEPDSAAALPDVADAVVSIILANYKLPGQLADYIAATKGGR